MDEKVYVNTNKYRRKVDIFFMLSMILIVVGIYVCVDQWEDAANFFSARKITDHIGDQIQSKGDYFDTEIDAGAFLENPTFHRKDNQGLSPYITKVSEQNRYGKKLYGYAFVAGDTVWEYYVDEEERKSLDEQLKQGAGTRISIQAQGNKDEMILPANAWYEHGVKRVDGKPVGMDVLVENAKNQIVQQNGMEIGIWAFSGIGILFLAVIFYCISLRQKNKKEPILLEFDKDAFSIRDYSEWSGKSALVLEEKLGEIRAVKKRLELEYRKKCTTARDGLLLCAGCILLFIIWTNKGTAVILGMGICYAIKKCMTAWSHTYNGEWNARKRKIQPYPLQEQIQNCDINMQIMEEMIRTERMKKNYTQREDKKEICQK